MPPEDLEKAAAAPVPSVPNPRRLPTADLADPIAMFADKRSLLGGAHALGADGDVVPCGATCPHRLVSVSCPFFHAPCLVGCVVKQVLIGEGLGYEEQEFFIVAQAGRYLIGQEVVLNLDNPNAARLRVVQDKLGQTVYASSGLTGSLNNGMDWKESR